MNSKTNEKIFIGSMTFLSIMFLILGKVYNENFFYFACVIFISLITNCIVIKGMVFDIFKNPKISKKSRLLLLFPTILYSTATVLAITDSNWILASSLFIMLLSNASIQFSNIKKEITER